VQSVDGFQCLSGKIELPTSSLPFAEKAHKEKEKKRKEKIG
jgi:hypothetical protein